MKKTLTRYATARNAIDYIGGRLRDLVADGEGKSLPDELRKGLMTLGKQFADYSDDKLKQQTGFTLKKAEGKMFTPAEVKDTLQEATGYIFKMAICPKVTRADVDGDDDLVESISPWTIQGMVDGLADLGLEVAIEDIQALSFVRNSNNRDEIKLVQVGLIPGHIWLEGVHTGRAVDGNSLCKSLEEFRHSI